MITAAAHLSWRSEPQPGTRGVAATLERAWSARSTRAGTISGGIDDAVLRALLASAAGPLAYARLKEDAQSSAPVLDELRNSYFLSRLQWSVKRRWAIEAVDRFRARGIEPIVIKGPIAALLYPDAALRPFGDIDLCVDPNRFEDATTVLREAVGALAYVDLHRGCPDLGDRAWSNLVRRSRTIELDDARLTTLSEEDHLRLLALHAMKHGCFRALWLCDIGAALENRTPRFDWDRFLSGKRRRTEYASAALQLAGELLGADLSGTPLADAKPLPRWMITDTLRLWESPSRWPGGRPLAATALLTQPLRTPRHLVDRIPGPLESTVLCGAPLRHYPRFPLQLLYMLIRLASLPRQLAALSSGP